ncbi:bifunctional acetate--CoA ligase family protein/GNAT family N-acetyltransferase [Massilia sp. G4R7]|uniref:Bifunctional acetate--CoA ligase family protein/GNAT family N-acetyltransferase n=1 Tax=Massilia phyllostachyos TaxID=2898585 RepID=A0ABS8Q379_9BURK|nr:bifunctional acetate--CoA ligase family protein/GNAT family N-acetyltransferase [Massilia phyllostachyos]MCD2516194.1 bifunctional acetate--CoA ligase family protein/GNAT family N-acetyltransferase [Massilia phyllostachyos]
MSIRNLQHLFAPASVAVIGASDRPGSVGATVWRNLAAGGFAGPLWPVNRRHARVGGQAAWPSVAALPGVPELAVICTPAAGVPGLVHELGAAGCRAAVVLSAGLGAPDPDGPPGATLRQAMLEAARPWLLRILGPNCVGLLVPGIGLNASFAPGAALPGRLAFVAQSGALVTAVLDWAAARRIGFSCFVSLGDGSDVDFGDLLDWLAADPGTDAILLYAESVRQARKFMSAARGAARAKPTLVVKAGRGAEAARAAFSHTGALAGSDLVYDAAIRRAGMLRVGTTGELFDAVAMLARVRPPRGERLAILTNGGGPGVMALDALHDAGGVAARLGAGTLARLDAVLPPLWPRANPVDIIGDAPAARYRDALALLLDGPECDAVLLIHAPTALVPSAEIAAALLPLLGQAGRPVLCCWLGGPSVAEARRLCIEAGVPVFDTPEEAVKGFQQLVDYRRNAAQLLQAPGPAELPAPDRQAARSRIDAMLAAGRLEGGDLDAKALLAAYGVPVLATEAIPDRAGALAAARRIGYPVALKILSPDIPHKTEVGGVALDLAGDAALAAALDAMEARVRALRPQARLQGYTVQAMARRPQALELIVGLTVDPVFGPVVLFGQGGIAVELSADQAVALPPLNRLLAAELIGRTRVARLLQGYRGLPPADLDALADVLVRVGRMAAELPELVELDINPLLADATGVLALDARLRLAPVPAGQDAAARLAILPYPAELERRADSALGPLTIRPIRPEDAQAHIAFFRALTPEDVHMRMFGMMRELTPQQLARFTQIDYAREMAFIATRPVQDGAAADGAETLGVARVVLDPDGERGEFAVTVRSDLKGRGLGRLLMERLLDYCAERGVAVVEGAALPENTRMHALAATLGFALDRGADGVLRMRRRFRQEAA